MKEIILKLPRFQVARRALELPGKGRREHYTIVHPGAVLILPLLTPTSVVMIRNVRYSIDMELLELPAGTLEPGEQPIRSAARELEEETGYRAEHIEPLCRFYTSPGFTDELMHVFVARELKETSQQLDETEQIRVEVLSLDEALKATADGRILDGKTIAALQLYRYRMGG